MGLQIWLPLNKSGEQTNQGLSEARVTASTATFVAPGVVGATGNFGDGTPTWQAKGVFLNTNCSELGSSRSICAWVRPKGNHLNYSGAIASSGNWNRTRWGFCLKQDNTGITGFDAGYSSYFSMSIPTNSWTHVCVTVENGVTKFYKNGVYVGSQNRGSGSVSSDDTSMTIGRETYAGGYFSFNGDISDVRIYDECISDKEVSEIAMGLIAHYKLSDAMSESTRNYAYIPTVAATNIVNSYGWDKTLHANAIRVNGWSVGYNSGVSDPATVYHAYWAMIESEPTIVFTDKNSEKGHTHSWLGISGGLWGDGATECPITAGTTYTISFDAKADVAGKSVSTGMYFKKTSSSGNNFWDGCNAIPITTEWKRYSVTYTCSEFYAISSFYIYGHYGTEGTSYVRRYQVEVKDHATDYCIGHRDSSVIDCSGLHNDAMPYGSISVKSDTLAPYEKYTYFNGVDNAINIGNLSQLCSTSYTMNCWIYKDGNWGSKAWETIFGGPSGFEYQSRRGGTASPVLVGYSWGQSSTGGQEYTLNEWHMVTMSRTASSCIFYLDGEPYYTGSTGSIPSGDYFVGSWNNSTSQNYKGGISDFRLYGTALTADQIKSLYQLRASIGDKNDLHIDEIKELGSGNLAILTNKALTDKKFEYGLSHFTQAKCVVTLDGETYRIYREPNLTYPGDGRVMWGGFVLDNTNNRYGFVDGHTYVLEFSVSGQSTNHPTMGWSNLVGWSGGGLSPNPSNVTSINPLGSNTTTDGWADASYQWTINDGVYKVCTTSYSSFVSGTTYVSYKGFKYGWDYESTGELGSDVYIKNIRLYDITGTDTKIARVKRNYETECNSILEHDGIVSVTNSYDILANKFKED